MNTDEIRERQERSIFVTEQRLRKAEATVTAKVESGEITQEQADEWQNSLARRRLQARIDFLQRELAEWEQRQASTERTP